MAETLEAVITRVSQQGDGIQVEGFEEWFNLGRNYKGPQLKQGLHVEISYGPWTNSRGETKFYINSARIIDGQAGPAPTAAPRPTPTSTQPNSYQGYQDAATQPTAKPTAGLPAREDGITWANAINAAVECLKANLDYSARKQGEDTPLPIQEERVLSYAKKLYGGRPWAEPQEASEPEDPEMPPELPA